MNQIDHVVHDLVFQWGGAESVLSRLCSLAPSAPLHVIAGDRDVLQHRLPGVRSEVAYPQLRSNAMARAAVPAIAATLPKRRPLTGRVLISSYAMARWFPSASPRLIYCHAPMRQIWHGSSSYTAGRSPEAMALRLFSPYLRTLDRRCTRAEDWVATPSPRVAELHERVYGRKVNAVIPPPVDSELFERALGPDAGYYLWVGRVVEPVKRLSLLLKAFAAAPSQELIVVGDGRSRVELERLAPPNVRFRGWLDGAALLEVMAGARALLLPSMEDFGLVGAEALALGVPLLTTKQAGVAHWVTEGENGAILAPTAEAFAAALVTEELLPRGAAVRASAQPFSVSAFRAAVLTGAHELGWR